MKTSEAFELVLTEEFMEEEICLDSLFLHQGWNLISAPYDCDWQDERIEVIWQYNQGWSSPEQLLRGRGYWIKASETFYLILQKR